MLLAIFNYFADGDHGGVEAYVIDLISWRLDTILQIGVAKFPPAIGEVTGDGVMDIVAQSNTILPIFYHNYNLIRQISGLADQLNVAVVANSIAIISTRF